MNRTRTTPLAATLALLAVAGCGSSAPTGTAAPPPAASASAPPMTEATAPVPTDELEGEPDPDESATGSGSPSPSASGSPSATPSPTYEYRSFSTKKEAVRALLQLLNEKGAERRLPTADEVRPLLANAGEWLNFQNAQEAGSQRGSIRPPQLAYVDGLRIAKGAESYAADEDHDGGGAFMAWTLSGRWHFSGGRCYELRMLLSGASPSIVTTESHSDPDGPDDRWALSSSETGDLLQLVQPDGRLAEGAAIANRNEGQFLGIPTGNEIERCS